MLRHVQIALAALLLAAGSASAQSPLSTLGTADDGSGWEAVGRLDIGTGGFCTGALIAAEIVLTAAHCLFAESGGDRIDPAGIEFRAGLRYGRAEAYRGVRRVVVHPDYDGAALGRLANVGRDLALLELDRPIRLGHVRPFRTRMRVEAGQVVDVVSYARDRAEAPSREAGCAVLARDDDVLVLSCEADFGASGSPVLLRQGDETRLVSVISAKAEWNGRRVSLAPAMEGELDALIAAFSRTPAFAPVGKSVAAEALDAEPVASR